MDSKYKKIITISCFIIISCLVLVLLFTKSGSHKELTPKEFKSIMEKNKYRVIDVTKQMENYYDISKIYLAYGKKYKYKIEFYEFVDKDKAKKFYEKNERIFDESKSSKAKVTSNKFFNGAKYTVVSNEKYRVVSRISDTVVFVNVNKKYKNYIDSILKKIGY